MRGRVGGGRVSTVFDSAFVGAAYSASQRGGALCACVLPCRFWIRGRAGETNGGDANTRDRLCKHKKSPIIHWQPFDEPPPRVVNAISPDRISVYIKLWQCALDSEKISAARERSRGTLLHIERGALSCSCEASSVLPPWGYDTAIHSLGVALHSGSGLVVSLM